MIQFLIRIALMVLVLLVVVPAVTGNKVAVRQGGFFRGLMSLFVIGLFNSALWFVFALVTAGGAILANMLTFGLIGLVVNALAFVGTSKLMPETLHVESFGSAFWASLWMTAASCLIHMFV